MRKILYTLFLLLVTVMASVGQNLPGQVSMKVKPFEYKMSKGTVAMTLLGVAASPNRPLLIPDKSMIPQMNEAIAAAPSNLPWVIVSGDGTESADYHLEGVIYKAEASTLDAEFAQVDVSANVSLVDDRTGKIVATKSCNGFAGSYDVIRDLAGAKSLAARRLTNSIVGFILQVLPIEGTILEKGVEQANGKTKEKQCYVDLGSQHGIYKDLELYVTENGNYKAELKVVEVMGEDLCTCKVTKGDSYVNKSLEKGVNMVVTSKPKKL